VQELLGKGLFHRANRFNQLGFENHCRRHRDQRAGVAFHAPLFCLPHNFIQKSKIITILHHNIKYFTSDRPLPTKTNNNSIHHHARRQSAQLPLVCLKTADFKDTKEVTKGKNTVIGTSHIDSLCLRVAIEVFDADWFSYRFSLS
jgi:hypothetical protein